MDVGSLLITDRQTEGKGRHGSAWEDMQQEQLFCSMALPLLFDDTELPITNLWISLHVVSVLQNLYDLSAARIKWPNDIFLSGEKVGGVMSEKIDVGTQSCLIAGLGINLSPNSSSAYTSLSEHNSTIHRMDLLTALITQLDASSRLSRQERKAWIQASFQTQDLFAGINITVQSHGKIEQGISKGIDDRGRLLLEQENGDTVPISQGSIQL